MVLFSLTFQPILKGKIVVFDTPFINYETTVVYRAFGASYAAAAGAVAMLVRYAKKEQEGDRREERTRTGGRSGRSRILTYIVLPICLLGVSLPFLSTLHIQEDNAIKTMGLRRFLVLPSLSKMPKC